MSGADALQDLFVLDERRLKREEGVMVMGKAALWTLEGKQIGRAHV